MIDAGDWTGLLDRSMGAYTGRYRFHRPEHPRMLRDDFAVVWGLFRHHRYGRAEPLR